MVLEWLLPRKDQAVVDTTEQEASATRRRQLARTHLVPAAHGALGQQALVPALPALLAARHRRHHLLVRGVLLRGAEGLLDLSAARWFGCNVGGRGGEWCGGVCDYIKGVQSGLFRGACKQNMRPGLLLAPLAQHANSS